MRMVSLAPKLLGGLPGVLEGEGVEAGVDTRILGAGTGAASCRAAASAAALPLVPLLLALMPAAILGAEVAALGARATSALGLEAPLLLPSVAVGFLMARVVAAPVARSRTVSRRAPLPLPAPLPALALALALARFLSAVLQVARSPLAPQLKAMARVGGE